MSNSPNGSFHSSSGRENPTGNLNSTPTNRRNSKDSPVAFYQIPSWVPNVPSKIINEAKQSLKETPTTRPYTPREDTRVTLSKLKHGASPFSLTTADYETESRPSSAKPAEIIRRNSRDLVVDGNNAIGNSSVLRTKLSRLNHAPSQESSRPVSEKVSTVPKPTSSSSTTTTTTTNAASNSQTSSSSRHSAHRQSSASGKEESSDESLIWKHEITPLIETLITAYEKNHFEQFDRTAKDIYNALAKYNLFGRKNSKKRGEILKILFGFIGSNNSIVRFHVARLSLAFHVSSAKNLMNIVRVTADLSLIKENDHFFVETNLLDLLLETIERADFGENIESLSYFCVVLKNLTMNNDLIPMVSNKKPFELLKKILKHLLQLKDQPQFGALLFEGLRPLTATLRNLAQLDENRHQFSSNDLIDHLTFIAKYFTDKSHADILKTIAGIFSNLTQHSDFCLKLVQCSSCYRSFLKILIKHENDQALVVRICFVLGNLMAKSEDARLKFMSDPRALQTLTKLLQSYIQLDSLVLKPEKLDNDESTSQDLETNENQNLSQFFSIENVIKKLIRVLSNAAISNENGLMIIRRDECIDLLFKLLKAPNQHSEELLVHVLMALNNLSYYDDPQSFISRNAETLAQLLVKYVRNEERMDCVIEAFRVLGNLSRLQKIRDRLMKCEVDQMAIKYCQSDNVELLYAVIGVIINLTVDEDKRECLRIHGGIDNLINIFEYSIQSDWQLSSLVCKALWNYCDNNYDNAAVQSLWFTDEQLKILFSLFEESLDESLLETTDDEQLDAVNKQFWNEEYFPVASRLYERLVEGFEHLHENSAHRQ